MGKGEEGAGTPPCRCPSLPGPARRRRRGGRGEEPAWRALGSPVPGGCRGRRVSLSLLGKKKNKKKDVRALSFAPQVAARASSPMAEGALAGGRRLPRTFQLSRPVSQSVRRAGGRLAAPNGRRRGGTAGAGGRSARCAGSRVRRRPPDAARPCEERRWLPRFLAIGRVKARSWVRSDLLASALVAF